MIDSFRGQYRFMSNFFPVSIVYMGMVFPSVEHLFVGLKAGNEPALGVLDCATPGLAKKFGRMIQLRPDWEQVKVKVMLYCLRQKFNQPGFRQDLLATAPHVLIEGNQWHDNYWGHCYCPRCNDKAKLNMLGQLLMTVRAEIGSSPDHMFWLKAA